MFNIYPYQNINDLNLDWIINQMKRLNEIVETFIHTETITFADPIQWNITTQYQPNTIVLDSVGNAYLSKEPVPAGIAISDALYWLEIFNFAAYVETANKNLTFNMESNTDKATAAYSVDDWLLWDNVLYKVIAPIVYGDDLEISVNIEHFTVEDFCRAWVTTCSNLITQYKTDIDNSELAFTINLQQQFDQVLAGVTVDSEVINARLGANNVNYATLRDAIVSQFKELYYDYRNFLTGTLAAATGANYQSTTTFVTQDFIDIDDFIYLKVDAPFRFQVYCYDADGVAIGYTDASWHTEMNRSAVLTAQPTAGFVRVKFGRSDGVTPDPADLDSNGYICYLNRPYDGLNHLTHFVNGTINPSLGTVVYYKDAIVSDIIPIESFTVATTSNTMQIYCYDENRLGIGYTDGSMHTIMTKSEVLTAIPTAKYIRVKFRGSNITPADLESTRSYAFITFQDGIVRLNLPEQPLIDKLGSFANSSGVFDGTFTADYAIKAGATSKILKIRSQYAGTRPTLTFYLRSYNDTIFTSTEFSVGGEDEPITQYIRLPRGVDAYVYFRLTFTIQSGSTLDIKECEVIEDNKKSESDIKWISHLGYCKQYPPNVALAFDGAADMGYKHMITTPKFTSDNIAVCFHDDATVRNALRYKDGSTITPSSVDDAPISAFTYAYLVQTFSAGYKMSAIYADCVVPTLDEFFRICSLNGIHPVLSLHPQSEFSGATGDAHFQTIKALAKKYNLLDKLRLKVVTGPVAQCVANNFDGAEIEGVIIVRPSADSWDPLTFAKTYGLVDATATSATESDYHLTFELFSSVATSSEISNALNEGFVMSVVCSDVKRTSTEFDTFISYGVSEFSVDYMAETGLYY